MARDTHTGRGASIGIVVLVAGVAGVAGLTVSNRAEPNDGERAAAPRSTVVVSEPAPKVMYRMEDDPRTAGYHGVPPAPAPPGKSPLAFDDDRVTALAGYIEDEGPNGWDDGEPPLVLDIGTGRYVATGEEVTDIDGGPVGYSVDGIGFIDLATAGDPAMVDALLADAEARVAAEPQPSEEEEEEMARLFGIEAGGG